MEVIILDDLKYPDGIECAPHFPSKFLDADRLIEIGFKL